MSRFVIIVANCQKLYKSSQKNQNFRKTSKFIKLNLIFLQGSRVSRRPVILTRFLIGLSWRLSTHTLYLLSYSLFLSFYLLLAYPGGCQHIHFIVYLWIFQYFFSFSFFLFLSFAGLSWRLSTPTFYRLSFNISIILSCYLLFASPWRLSTHTFYLLSFNIPSFYLFIFYWPLLEVVKTKKLSFII